MTDSKKGELFLCPKNLNKRNSMPASFSPREREIGCTVLQDAWLPLLKPGGLGCCSSEATGYTLPSGMESPNAVKTGHLSRENAAQTH